MKHGMLAVALGLALMGCGTDDESVDTVSQEQSTAGPQQIYRSDLSSGLVDPDEPSVSPTDEVASVPSIPTYKTEAAE